MMDMVARRWVLMLAVMIFGLALSIGFGLGQRPVYHAREVLQVVPPKVAQELAATTVAEQAQAQRDSVSAVNLDEEAVNLMAYEQAYQANMKVISTSNDLFNAVLAMF